MSNEAITFVRKMELKPSGLKFVAFCLADYADEAWSCYPSVAKICQFTGQGEKTVRDHLNTLESSGFLTRSRNRYDDGKLAGYRFVINKNYNPAAKFATGENFHKPAAKFAGQEPPLDPPYTTLDTRTRDFPIPPNLSKKLCEAAEIVDETKTPGLLVLSEPLNWIDNGCDFDLDILPTLRARPKPDAKSWAYWRQAVFEAKARREAPAPDISLPSERIFKKRETNTEKAKRLGLIE